MRQWKSLVPAALHLHGGPAASCFPHPPSPSPCPSPPRVGAAEETDMLLPTPPQGAAATAAPQQAAKAVVRLVGCDGRVRAYAPPVTARELMQEHPRHLVCRADALLIGEKIPAVAAGEELQPGEAYFLLPAHLFRSVLSFVSLASSLLLLLSSTASAAGTGNTGKKPGRPFELHRTASGTLQIKFSDDFLLAGAGKGSEDDEAEDADAAAQVEDKQQQQPGAVLLRGDARLAKDYEELVGYSKSRRWAPKLETIEEAVAPTVAAGSPEPASPKAAARSSRSRRALPFLGRLGSRRRRDRGDACSAVVACSG